MNVKRKKILGFNLFVIIFVYQVSVSVVQFLSLHCIRTFKLINHLQFNTSVVT